MYRCERCKKNIGPKIRQEKIVVEYKPDEKNIEKEIMVCLECKEKECKEKECKEKECKEKED